MREYIWLDDMPLAVVADIDTPTPNLYFVHADHLDRPIKMTDALRVVVWDAIYKPFGDVYLITGLASNNLRFPGQYFLIESGLHYNWHRHYDPTLGRYTQPDPVADIISPIQSLQGANIAMDGALKLFADGPGVYGYAQSAPTMKVDKTGLFSGPVGPAPKADSCNNDNFINNGDLIPVGGKSPTFRCVNCSAPTGGVYYPYCPQCYVKSLDPKGEVAPIPKITSVPKVERENLHGSVYGTS